MRVTCTCTHCQPIQVQSRRKLTGALRRLTAGSARLHFAFWRELTDTEHSRRTRTAAAARRALARLQHVRPARALEAWRLRVRAGRAAAAARRRMLAALRVRHVHAVRDVFCFWRETSARARAGWDVARVVAARRRRALGGRAWGQWACRARWRGVVRGRSVAIWRGLLAMRQQVWGRQCQCMHVHVYIDAYAYTCRQCQYMHVHVYIDVYVYIHVHTHTCRHICIYLHIYTCMYAYI